jgi:hypothetical protein
MKKIAQKIHLPGGIFLEEHFQADKVLICLLGNTNTSLAKMLDFAQVQIGKQ